MTELRFSLTVPPTARCRVRGDRRYRDYARWLPGSGTYTGVATISPGPVGVGTTYTDRGPLSAMRGEVTEYAPSEALAFRQELRMAPLPGAFTIQMQYQLRAVDDHATWVERPFPFVPRESSTSLRSRSCVYTRRHESWRIKRALQRYLATSPSSS